MGLTNEQVQELVKKRPRKKLIEIGIRHQNRLRFHTETAISTDDLSIYFDTYKNWLGSDNPVLLPKDKISRFLQLLTVPIGTVELTEDIFTNLSKLFNAQDAFFKYNFDDAAIEEDWTKYRDSKFWSTYGFEAARNAIDSVWVLDLPSEQKTPLPQPKDKLINISQVIDIDVDENNVCKHVIFKLGDNYFVYDDEQFLAYRAEKNIIAPMPFIVKKHGLGYTPARMFWTDRLQSENLINRKAPLTNVLSDLDWFLTHLTFKKYMDIANSFPITVAYKPQQNFEGSDEEVNRGKPEDERNRKGGNLMGPGSFLTVDPPLAGEPDPMSNPVALINPDVGTLEFHVTESVRLRLKIFQAVVGSGGEPKNDEAKNEKQIMSSFEEQTAVLRRLAYNFEEIQRFADKCKIDVIYGVGKVKDIVIDYGQKFFLKTVADLTQELSDSKTNGSHAVIIDSIIDEINETKFKNDQKGMNRMRIIRDLDPLPEQTLDESIKIVNMGGITRVDFIIKSHLMNFVRRFEREQQVPLVDFASKRSYDLKISSILDEFKKYAQEMIDSEPEEEPEEIVNELKNNE